MTAFFREEDDFPDFMLRFEGGFSIQVGSVLFVGLGLTLMVGSYLFAVMLAQQDRGDRSAQ